MLSGQIASIGDKSILSHETKVAPRDKGTEVELPGGDIGGISHNDLVTLNPQFEDARGVLLNKAGTHVTPILSAKQVMAGSTLDGVASYTANTTKRLFELAHDNPLIALALGVGTVATTAVGGAAIGEHDQHKKDLKAQSRATYNAGGV